jgi:hypothetical protein
MSHATVTDLFSYLCPWLALVWSFQGLARVCGLNARGWSLLLLAGLAAIGLLAVPVQGVAIARWITGLNANFSIPFTGLLAIAVCERAFPRELLTARDWWAGWAFGSVAGLVLYPLALGWGPFDPYVWGWRFSVLFVATAALTGLLIWKQNRFGFLLLLSIVAYHLGLLESANYWDDLLDPVYCLVSVFAVGRRLVARFRRQAPQSGS